MEKKLYLVETISMFRVRYVVEAKEAGHANDEVVMNSSGGYREDFSEFSQHYVDECITSTREITEEEYLKLFGEDNEYLASWTDEEKKKFINKIDYQDEIEHSKYYYDNDRNK
jgi:hypothetical protein